jgi:hypothetical protein
MKLTTRVIELEPGWLLVCFKGAKPPADKRAFWLQRTLGDWLGDHPGHKVRRIVSIQDGGELQAVHVWIANAGEPTAADKKRLPVKIHHRLVDQMPAEHMEALLHYAYDTFFQHPGKPGVLAVVSRGGNVVLFDRTAEKCYVLPLSELQNLPAEAHEKIKRWQAAAGTAYFAIELGGFETP